MSRTILVVDDHPLVASALTMAAQAVDPAVRVRTASTLADAEARAKEERPDLLLLDLMLPDAQGFAGLALVRAVQPDMPVAIVSSRDEDATVRKALALGARGFLSKSAPLDHMVAAIRVLLDGGRWFPDGLSEDAGRDELAERIGSLSVAQLRVLRAIADGAQNKRIAYDLDLAIPTVKSHLAAIFKKLGVANRTQAVLALRAFDADEAG